MITITSKSKRMARSRRCGRENGNAFIMAVIFLAVLTMLIGGTITVVTSQAPANSQALAWNDARYAAEAGIDLAINQLKRNITAGPASSTADWTGWIRSGGTNATGTDLLISSTGGVTATTLLTGAAVLCTGTMLSTGASGTASYVNVSVQSLGAGGTSSSNYWFKIRSIGTTPVFGPPRSAMMRWDSDLRRPSLSRVRATIAGQIPAASLYPPWWGATPALATKTATVSRVIEVLVKPDVLKPFRFGIFTNASLSLPNSNNYKFVSYDSAYLPNPPTSGSPAPVNPGDPNYNTSFHKNADIGTNNINGASPAISIPKSPEVYGDVSVPAGSTVSNSAGYTGALGNTTMPMPVIPAPGDSAAYNTLVVNNGKTTNITVAPGSSVSYVTSSDLGDMVFTSGSATSAKAYVTIVTSGGWDATNVSIPANLVVTVYLNGDINFHNGSINSQGSSPVSSGLPGNLLIIGTSTLTAPRPSFNTNGNPTAALNFYGPNYAVSWAGGGNGGFMGSLVSYSLSQSGGGNSSFYYDEEAANVMLKGVTDYLITSYFEDSRE